MNDIYKVPPADNVKLAEIEMAVEKAWKVGAGSRPETLLQQIQSLIERIKKDDKKIRKLEKMNGITWLGDEQKGKGGKGRTAATLYKDRSAWAIPINCAGGGFRLQAYWQGREDGAREMEEEMEKHGK